MSDAQRLLGTLTGHLHFQTLVAAVELGLLERLGKGPATSAQLARSLRVSAHGLRVLLLGCCALGLLRRGGARYRLAPAARRFLLKRSPLSILPILKWQHEIVYKPMFHLTEAVKRGKNVGLKELPGTGRDLYARLAKSPKLENVFQDAMRALSNSGAVHLAAIPELRRAKRVLDVGGGDGTNALLVREVNPEAEVVVWDLPSVARRARMRGVESIAGNFQRGAFPKGFDVVLFGHLLSIYSPRENLALLKRARAALPKGGAVVVWGGIADDAETGPASAAAASNYFLAVATGRGMIWPWKDYLAWMKAAGFKRARKRPPMAVVGLK